MKRKFDTIASKRVDVESDADVPNLGSKQASMVSPGLSGRGMFIQREIALNRVAKIPALKEAQSRNHKKDSPDSENESEVSIS